MTVNLPYTVEKTFTLRGTLYPDEESALRAAIESTLGNVGVASTVIRECCALAPLLLRACDLGLGKQPPARDG